MALKHKTARRNQEIFAAHALGQSVELLADSYDLSLKTVREILSMERYKLAVSRDAFYENLRRNCSTQVGSADNSALK